MLILIAFLHLILILANDAARGILFFLIGLAFFLAITSIAVAFVVLTLFA